jgi:hypothetical protein
VHERGRERADIYITILFLGILGQYKRPNVSETTTKTNATEGATVLNINK